MPRSVIFDFSDVWSLGRYTQARNVFCGGMQVLWVWHGCERIAEEVCSQEDWYNYFWSKRLLYRLACARMTTFVCLISEISSQDAFQLESELFTKYYSEGKKKEVTRHSTYNTIPQFYFKVR
jgi:hypothetical protein